MRKTESRCCSLCKCCHVTWRVCFLQTAAIISCAAPRSYSCLPMTHEKPCVYMWSYWEDHTWRLCISNWIVKLAERLVACVGRLLGHRASCLMVVLLTPCTAALQDTYLKLCPHLPHPNPLPCESVSLVGLHPTCPSLAVSPGKRQCHTMTESCSAASPALGRCCCKWALSLW